MMTGARGGQKMRSSSPFFRSQRFWAGVRYCSISRVMALPQPSVCRARNHNSFWGRVSLNWQAIHRKMVNSSQRAMVNRSLYRCSENDLRTWSSPMRPQIR